MKATEKRINELKLTPREFLVWHVGVVLCTDGQGRRWTLATGAGDFTARVAEIQRHLPDMTTGWALDVLNYPKSLDEPTATRVRILMRELFHMSVVVTCVPGWPAEDHTGQQWEQWFAELADPEARALYSTTAGVQVWPTWPDRDAAPTDYPVTVHVEI